MEKRSSDALTNFGRLEEAATFFLYTAFDHVHMAAQLEVAGMLFAERIQTIDPEPGWVVPSLPATLPELLHEVIYNDVQVISEATASKLAHAWEEAQALAPSSGRRITKSHAIESIEIVGHIINLAACVESVINRHLFFMREAGTLESHLYSNLDRTEVVPKILFAFKAEIQSKQLSTSRLVHLFRLRNQAVHFKASSAESIKPTVEELLGIWQEMGPFLELVNGAPTRQELTNLVSRVANTWFA
jgi:hypothetical protein